MNKPNEHRTRNVIVTGAASGIGYAVASLFAREGDRVVLFDRDGESLRQAIEGIASEGGEAEAWIGDVTDSAAISRFVGDLVASRGSIDVLVNCAGAFFFGPAEDVSDANWQQIVAVNLEGTFLWCREVARAAMLPAGAGVIINVASTAGLVAGPGSAPYTAAKHGVVGLTKALAVEWAGRGVRVNAVCPGLTETPMVRRAWQGRQEAYAQRLARIPSGVGARPEEQAAGILFLASSAASAITGSILPIDGGTSALSSGYSPAS